MTTSADLPMADRPATIAMVVLLGAVAVAGFNIQPLVIGALADHLGLNARQLGLIAGLEIAGGALAGIAGVFWIRRWPWRRVAIAALLALAVGNFASTFAESHSSLLFIRSLTGFFGVGPNYALAIAALSDTTRRERNFSIAVVVQVGLAMLALAILPTFIADFGPAAAFLTLGGLALLLLPLVGFLPERAGAAEDAPPLVESRLPIWMALGCQATWYLGVGGIWAFVERMGADAGIEPTAVGNALAVGMGVGLLGAVLAASVADRFGRVAPFAVAMAGQVLAIYWLTDLEHARGLLLAICVYNGTWNFALPYLFSIAALADSRGHLIVLMMTAQSVGLTAGGPLAGDLIERFGLSAVGLQGAATALAALALFAWLSRLLRQAQ